MSHPPIKFSDVKPLKIAVIGAGMMGQHHLRICSQLKEVELVAVVELDKNKALEMAARFGILACTHVDELIGKVEAAIVAVPSILHLEVGRQCLSNHIHCLIEKPLAVTEAQCLELIHLAEKNKLMLLVGHVERFNAAIQQLSKELINKQHRIQIMNTERLNLNVQRAVDVDVILDLMTHDLDIILSFMNKPVRDISIQTIEHFKAGEADFASALVAFEDGAVANISASRMTQKKVRKLEVTTDGGHFTLDFLTQEIWLHRGNNNNNHSNNNSNNSNNNQIEQIAVHKQDALTAEILNFVQSVRSGIALGVTGKEALKTLKLIWQLQEKGRAQQEAHRMQKQRLEVTS